MVTQPNSADVDRKLLSKAPGASMCPVLGGAGLTWLPELACPNPAFADASTGTLVMRCQPVLSSGLC